MGRQTLRGIDDIREVASGWLLALRAGASLAGLAPLLGVWGGGRAGGFWESPSPREPEGFSQVTVLFSCPAHLLGQWMTEAKPHLRGGDQQSVRAGQLPPSQDAPPTPGTGLLWILLGA